MTVIFSSNIQDTKGGDWTLSILLYVCALKCQGPSLALPAVYEKYNAHLKIYFKHVDRTHKINYGTQHIPT